ncbi:MAG: MFS transporter [Clostridia bacterium]
MGKIKQLGSSAVNGTKKGVSYLKNNWHEPQKEGYQISMKGFMGMNLSSMGIEGMSGVVAFLSFTSTSAVLGLIFGLSLQATYIITSMGTVLNLLFVPIIANITDNIGVVDKATLHKIHLGFVATVAICAGLWFAPITYFDFLLTDFLKHIAIILGIKYASVYMYLLVYKLFGKHGKYKPWILFMGIPTLIFAIIMVNIDYQNYRASQLLIIVNIVSTCMQVFSVPYVESYKRMKNLLTNNNKERTTIYSVLPILSGILNSATTTLLPIVATLIGYEVNSIGLYKVVVPAFGVFSIATSFFILWTEEKIKFVPEKKEQRLGFMETIKTVFANKYLWVVYVAAAFSTLSTFDLILFNWMLLYSLREQWIMGILLTICSLPATPGNLLTPFLVKRFDSRKLILSMKLLQIALVIAHIPFIFMGNKVMVMVLMTALGCVTTLVRVPKGVMEKTAAAQALDYHQWKFGKRVDESVNYFQYITVPLMLILGYCSPYLMSLVGFVSDRDILYDSEISNGVFVFLVILYILELLGGTIPYFFFDLDDKKLETIRIDLEERKRVEALKKQAEKEEASVSA